MQSRPVLPAVLALFLASCGGGSFGTGDVISLDSAPKPPKPSAQDEKLEIAQPENPQQTLPEYLLPSVGFGAALPLRNTAQTASGEDVEPVRSIQAADMQTNGGGMQESSGEAAVRALAAQKNLGVFQSNNTTLYAHLHFGYIATEPLTEEKADGTRYEGSRMYLYYRGFQTASALPVQGKAVYRGDWAFVTDARISRKKVEHTGEGQVWLSSADGFSGPSGMSEKAGVGIGEGGSSAYEATEVAAYRPVHQSAFEADFAGKKLTGTLSKADRTPGGEIVNSVRRYGISADIRGNRFQGSAFAADKSDPLFGKDASGRLEGGFFGRDGAELAGRFLTDDNSLLAIFAGKRGESSGSLTAVPMFDSEKIILSRDGVAKVDLDSFGDVSVLLVEGRKIPLLPQEGAAGRVQFDGQTAVGVCCTSLQFTRFGSMNQNRPDGAQREKQKAASSRKAKLQALDKREQELAVKIAQTEETAQKIAQNLGIGETGYEALLEAIDAKRAQAESEEDLNALFEWELRVEDLDGRRQELAAQQEEVQTQRAALNHPDALAQERRELLEEAKYAYHGDSLFIQGVRTQDMPSAGTAHYRGHWQAQLAPRAGRSAWGVLPERSQAQFAVDFGKKTLSGSLSEKGRRDPLFTVDAEISGSGFAGRAKTGEFGIALVRGESGRAEALLIDAAVSGSFYGPAANELGGSFISEKDGLGGVFGAKKQQEVR